MLIGPTWMRLIGLLSHSTMLCVLKKVFVNGAFDVLHSGHLNLLDFAGRLGGHLLVAIDTDEKIRYNKIEMPKILKNNYQEFTKADTVKLQETLSK